MRAPCFSKAWANAYADEDCGSSLSDGSLQRVQRQQQHYSTCNRQSSPLRRKRTSRLSILTPLLLLLIALPVASALFDPGAAEEPRKPSVQKMEADSAIPQPTTSNKRLTSSEGSSLSLLSTQGDPVSLHPGCRRTTDLFDNVCHNPWSPVFGRGPRGSNSASRSELVICPLGEVSKDGQKEKVFAITGTITLPESTFDHLEASSSTIDSFGVQSTIGGDKESYWPKPGDEGFWRQRDGELEWVPTEARALLESDVTPASSVKEAKEGAIEKGEKVVSDAQEKEYDAWSASIGGEDSETWLSFEQWREKHLAAEREIEKQKSAAGRKQKSDKLKEKKPNHAKASSGNSSEGADKGSADPSGQPHPADVKTATAGEQSSTSAQQVKETNPQHATTDRVEAQAAAPSATSAESLPSETPPSVEEGSASEQPAAVKADTSQDTGSIPAVGNASSRLTELKHRWNFASLDCAAVVHRSNPSAKFTSSILSEKKDRYMLSPCPEDGSEGQFVVVELCDEISVDTIVLANFEFFSRMFKRFRVRVSRNLNGGDGEWYDIGTFRARNIRGLQIFNTTPPTADSRFFRYVRIDFLEHYGSEYYCPVSLLRVYGLTQMDDYIREEEEMKKQREAELLQIESEGVEDADEETTEAEAGAAIETETETGTAAMEHAATETASTPAEEAASAPDAGADPPPTPVQITADAVGSPASTSVEHGTSSMSHATKAESSASVSEASKTPSRPAARNEYANDTVMDLPDSPEMRPGVPVVSSGHALYNTSYSEMPGLNGSAAQINSSLKVNETHSTNVTAEVDASRQVANDTAASGSPLPAANDTASSVVDEGKTKAVNASTVPQAASTNTQEANRPAGGNSQQQQQQQQQHHGGSESIYRTITKRLNTLEMNATLSLQYMEHSRQQLREVFGRMERNQRDKIAEMLRELNSSNWRQIESLKRRQQVDLQQAIFEFDKHRQQTDAERRALLAQMHILSSEVMMEKRFGVAQLILLLGLFVFMVLTRGSRAVPLLHQGIARISNKVPSKRGSPKEESNTRQAITHDDRMVKQARDAAGNLRSSVPHSAPRDAPRHLSRAASSTPRGDRMQKSFDRPVRLRGSGLLGSRSMTTSRRHHSISQVGPPPFSPFSPTYSKYAPSVTLSSAKQEGYGYPDREQQHRVLMPLQNGALLTPGGANGSTQKKSRQSINIDTTTSPSESRRQRNPFSLAGAVDAAEDDIDTPVLQAPSRSSNSNSNSNSNNNNKMGHYEREDTPTNFRDAMPASESSSDEARFLLGQRNGGGIVSSSSAIIGDESFGGGSDWGTERSDEDESSQSHDWMHEGDGEGQASAAVTGAHHQRDDDSTDDPPPPNIASSSPNLLSPLMISSSSPSKSSPLRMGQDSDADEENDEGDGRGGRAGGDHPYYTSSHWNAVKNRRSLKRYSATAGGGHVHGHAATNGSSHPRGGDHSNGGNSNTHNPARVHTPTNQHHQTAASSIRSATPPRRHASPFSKDLVDMEMS